MVLVLVLLGLAVGSGVITWALYPSAPPQQPEPRPLFSSPTQKLVELPVSDPSQPVTTDDAGTPDAGSDADQDVRPEKRRRALPQGKIDSRRVTAFIRSKQGQVRQCYERRLRQNNILHGVLVAQIKISPAGRAMDVSFPQDTLHDSQVQQCVRSAIGSWQFPQPEGGYVVVSNPFRFEPRTE
jgi:hypothetical protein